VAGHRFGGAEKVFKLFDTENARASEGCVVDGILAGKGSSMGGCSACRLLRATGLHRNNGFGPCGRARRRHELARISYLFHVHEYRTRVVIAGEVVQQITCVDISHVT
jgi:hypothetical protein